MSGCDVTTEWDLPEDVLEAIFCALPVQWIAISKAVAKSWRDVIARQPALEKLLSIKQFWTSDFVRPPRFDDIKFTRVARARDKEAISWSGHIVVLYDSGGLKYAPIPMMPLEAMCFSDNDAYLFGISTIQCFGWDLTKAPIHLTPEVIFNSDQDSNDVGALTTVLSAGRNLAVGGSTGLILTWKEGAWDACGQRLDGHTKRINSLASVTQGAILVSSSLDKTIRVWDVSRSECLNTFDTTPIVPGMSTCVSNHSEAVIAYGSSKDNTMALLGLRSGERGMLEGQDGVVTEIKGHGSRVLTTNSDGVVKFWDLEQGNTCTHTLFPLHSAPPHAAWLDANCAVVLSALGMKVKKIFL